MIELRISQEHLDIEQIVNLFAENFIDCECYNYLASVKGKKEKGIRIIFFDIDEKSFLKDIWEPLLSITKITCGFVSCETYKGCTRNWPDVFTPSKCP